MQHSEIRHLRLHNQHLLTSDHTSPVEVVRSLVAMQAQEYPGAKWAIGQRLLNAEDALIEKAFNDGELLRLHVMRPTWHFVTPDDVRWLVGLTAPRVNVACRTYYRKLELDDRLFKRTNRVLTKALQGGKHLTRDELRQTVKRAGIEPGDPVRFGLIMLRAELDGVVCSGPRRVNQFTYALLDERAPQSRTLERDEALAELTLRYFTTRGPATLQDYVWWSGLSTSDAKRGIEIVAVNLISEVVESKTYWVAQTNASLPGRIKRRAHLLPTYDEYLISYKDREASLPSHVDQKSMASRGVFAAPVVIDGLVVGSWKRVLQGKLVTVQVEEFRSLTKADRTLVLREARKYGDFLQKDLRVE